MFGSNPVLLCFVTVNFPFTGRDNIANTTETNHESIRGIYLKTSRLNLIKWRGFSSFMRYASFVFGLPIHRVSLCIVTSQSVTTHHELVRQWQAEHVLLHLSPCFDDGKFVQNHYIDVITSAMASQITGISIVYSTVCSDKKINVPHHWPLWLMNSQHKGLVTRKIFPVDDVIMITFVLDHEIYPWIVWSLYA